MANNQRNKSFCSEVCPWAIRQAKQASTWRGLAVLGGAIGVFGAPEQAHIIIGALGAVFGAADVARDDSK